MSGKQTELSGIGSSTADNQSQTAPATGTPSEARMKGRSSDESSGSDERNPEEDDDNRVVGHGFINQLLKIVEDDKDGEMIKWTQDGKSLVVYNRDKFAAEIIPRYFKHNRISSFIRQLNLYGFHRFSQAEVLSALERGHISLRSSNNSKATIHTWRKILAFSHPLFRRSHKSLASRIRRRISGSLKSIRDMQLTVADDNDSDSYKSNDDSPVQTGKRDSNVKSGSKAPTQSAISESTPQQLHATNNGATPAQYNTHLSSAPSQPAYGREPSQVPPVMLIPHHGNNPVQHNQTAFAPQAPWYHTTHSMPAGPPVAIHPQGIPMANEQGIAPMTTAYQLVSPQGFPIYMHGNMMYTVVPQQPAYTAPAPMQYQYRNSGFCRTPRMLIRPDHRSRKDIDAMPPHKWVPGPPNMLALANHKHRLIMHKARRRILRTQNPLECNMDLSTPFHEHVALVTTTAVGLLVLVSLDLAH
eukprot:Clim_evm11s195 gene=Clim_evmTU11s195